MSTSACEELVRSINAGESVASAEWGRLADLDSRFGIKRSTAYSLIAQGVIRSAVVRKNGARNDVRLIDLGSVREFLRSQSGG